MSRIVCITDGRSAILFVDQDARRYYHYKFEDLSGTGLADHIVDQVRRIAAKNGWTEALENRIEQDIFCQACGHFEFTYEAPQLLCSECGTRYQSEETGSPDFPIPLVPEVMAGCFPGGVDDGGGEGSPDPGTVDVGDGDGASVAPGSSGGAGEEGPAPDRDADPPESDPAPEG